jgi:hypothetical protein
VEFDGRGVFLPEGGINNIPYFYDVRARYADGMMLVMTPGSAKEVRFEGDEGWINVTDTGVVTSQPKSAVQGVEQFANLPAPRGHWNIMAPHIRNFLDSIRSRAQTVSNPEAAQRSHTIIHAANISIRLGRRLEWDARTETFGKDTEANRFLSRPMRAPWKV